MKEFESSIKSNNKLTKIAAAVNRTKRPILSRSRTSTPVRDGTDTSRISTGAILLKNETDAIAFQLSNVEALLESKVASYLEKLGDMEFRVKALTNFKKLYAAKAADEVKFTESIKQKREALSDRYNHHAKLHSQMTSSILDLKQQLDNFKSECKLLKEEKSTISQELAEYAQKLAIQENEVKSLNILLTGVRNELQYHINVNEGYKAEIELTREDFLKCQQSLEDHKLKIHAMSEEANEIAAVNSQRISSLTADNSRMEAEIVALEISLQYANEQLKNKKLTETSEWSTLEAQNLALQSAVDSYQKKALDLQKQLDQSNYEHSTISTEKTSLQDDVRSLHKKLADCSHELSQTQNAYEKLQKDFSEMCSECVDLSNKNAVQAGQLHAYLGDEDKAIEERRQLQLTVMNLSNDLEVKTAELKAAALTIRESDQIIQQNRSHVMQLEENLEKAHAKLQSLVDSKASNEATLERELESTRHMLNSKTAEAELLLSELNTLRFTLSSLQGEYSSLQRKAGQLQNIKSESAQLERQLRDEISALSKQLKQATDSKAELLERTKRETEAVHLAATSKDEEIESLTGELDILRGEIVSFKDELQDVKRTLQQRVAEMMEMSEVEHSLRNENSHLREIVEAKARCIESSERKITSLHQSLGERDSDTSILRNNLSLALADLEATLLELDITKQKHEEVEAANRKNVELLNIVSLERDSERAELEKSRQEVSCLNKDVVKLRDTVAALQADLNERDKSYAQQESLLKSNQASLQEKNTSLEARVQDLLATSSTESESHKQEILKMRDTIADKSREVSAYLEELEKSRNTLTKLQGEASNLRQNLIQQGEQTALKEAECNDLRIQLRALQMENASVSNLLEDAKKDSMELQRLLDAKSFESTSLKEALDKLQNQLTASLDNEQKKLILENRSLGDDNLRLSSTIADLKKEAARLSKENGALLMSSQAKDKENKLLQQEINDLRITQQSLERDLLSSTMKLTKQQNEDSSKIAEFEDQVRSLSKQTETLTKSYDAKVAETSLVQSLNMKEIERLRFEQVSLMSELDALRSENTKQSHKLTDMYKNHLADLENSKREIASIKRERDEAISRSHLTTEDSLQITANSTKEIEKCKKEINSLKIALSEKSSEVEVYLSQVQQLRLELDELSESKIRALCESEKRFLTERQTNREQQSALEEALQALDTIKRNTTAVIEQLQEENTKLRADLTSQSKALQFKSDELTAAEEFREKYRRQLQEAGNSMTSELQILKAELSSCKILLADKSSALLNLQEEKQQLLDLKSELLAQKSLDAERASNEIQALKSYLVNRSNDISALAQDNEALTAKIVNFSLTLDKLQNEVNVTRQLLRNKSLALDNSVLENEELRSKLSEFCSREERTVEKIRKDLAASRQVNHSYI